MIKVLYFARLREELKTSSESLDTVPDMRSLVGILYARGGEWADIFGGDQLLLMAVNQEMVELDTALADGDEVAFFPPVTGG